MPVRHSSSVMSQMGVLRRAQHGGVVDEHVHAAEFLKTLADHAVDLIRLGDVGGDGEGAVGPSL